MTGSEIDFYRSTIEMNLKLKNLLYIASTDPGRRRSAVFEASKMLDDHYHLPSGYLEFRGDTEEQSK